MLILPRRRAGFSSTSRVLHQLNIRVSMFSHQHLNLLRVCVCAGSRWRKQITFLLYLTFRRHSASSASAAGIKPPFGPPPAHTPPTTSPRPTPLHRPRLFSSLGAHVRPPFDRANILFSCCALFAFAKKRLGRHLPPLLKRHFCGTAAPGRDPSGTHPHPTLHPSGHSRLLSCPLWAQQSPVSFAQFFSRRGRKATVSYFTRWDWHTLQTPNQNKLYCPPRRNFVSDFQCRSATVHYKQ